MTSTRDIISWFLENNNLTMNQLASASGVTIQKVQSFIKGETNLPYKIALGLNKLLPIIKTEDIVSYDKTCGKPII